MFRPTSLKAKLLSWLVILSQILVPLGTASLTALQPTAAQTRSAGQGAGLPKFLTDSLAGLAWGAEQLFGAPPTAQAQATGPGGVSTGLVVWLRASNFNTGSQTWTDLAGGDNRSNTRFRGGVRFYGIRNAAVAGRNAFRHERQHVGRQQTVHGGPVDFDVYVNQRFERWRLREG
jgi:hypothetical protein